MRVKKNAFLLVLFVGFLQVVSYYIAGATVREDGAFSITQPDTLLYCQAARRIVEGHPFSFSEGADASSGTTSVLYPFVLAVLSVLGAKGDALFLAGFFLNAAFYLIFLCGWGVVIREKCEDGIPMLLGILLVALSGQSAFCALAASDTGFWMAVSALIAAGLVTNTHWLYIPLLILGPWIRPEGAMLAVALFLSSAVAMFVGIKAAKKVLLASLFAILSLVGVFALNYCLTGRCGFSSTANKGYFAFLPFSDAVFNTITDFAKIIKDFFLGQASLRPRIFQVLPFLGAVFIWLGVFCRNWQREGWWKEAGWLLAATFSILAVSLGNCEGENMDRYLAWLLPTMYVFMADGIAWFSSKCGSSAAKFAPAVILCLYALVAAVADVMAFHVASARADVIRSYCVGCESVLPPRASVGVFGGSGVANLWSPRRIRHLSGIYSPEFSIGKTPQVLEILKHDSSKRFDYWYLNTGIDKHLIFSTGKADFDALGEVVLRGPLNRELRKANWSIFDAASIVPDSSNKVSKLVARVDVGYHPDENAASYEQLTIYNQRFPHPFTVVAETGNGVKIFEAGRLLLGGDEMTVNLKPGCDSEVVLRTLSSVHSAAYDTWGEVAGGNCAFKSPMELMVSVDGEAAGKVSFEIREEGFTDAHFMIPGSAIKESPCRIGFHGEHVACCYWFYQ